MINYREELGHMCRNNWKIMGYYFVEIIDQVCEQNQLERNGYDIVSTPITITINTLEESFIDLPEELYQPIYEQFKKILDLQAFL